jgi:uncharacterized membrane protein
MSASRRSTAASSYLGMMMMNALAVASTLFFAVHLLPSTPLRPRAVALAGEAVYGAAFSIVSLLAIYWMVREFNAADYGGKLWIAPGWWLWVKAALVLFAYVLIIGGVLSVNPSAPGGEKLEDAGASATGIFAITRHPLMWGIALWAVTHLVSQGTWRGIAFFGSLAATALIGSWLQQRRKRGTVPGWAGFEAKTSFWPFAAILAGRAQLSLGAIGWWRIGVAVAAWAALLHYHFWLFKVQPLPFPV